MGRIVRVVRCRMRMRVPRLLLGRLPIIMGVAMLLGHRGEAGVTLVFNDDLWRGGV